MRSFEDYTDELRYKMDTLQEALDEVNYAIEDLKEVPDFKDYILDLRDATAGWYDIIDNMQEELEELEARDYEKEKKERNGVYNAGRL